MKRDLTTGSVFGCILYFALPFLLSYLLQTLYGMADLFIIGQYCGVDSTTAVSIGSQVMHMLTVMLVGLAMGATVKIGHAVGGGDRRQADRSIGTSIAFFLLLSVALTAVLLLAVRPIVSIMSTPEAAVDGTVVYLTICFAGVPFITAYNLISAIFRGMGDARSPMWFVAIACVANIALDLLFIGARGLGPAGAALGTTLSQALSVVLSVAVVRRRRMIPGLTRQDLRPSKPMLGAILRVGVPIAAQDGFIQISFLLITVFANQRGLNDAAAVGIVEKLIGFLFLVPSSMLSTVSALAAQNIGAGKHDRARLTLRYALMITVAYGAVCAVAMQFWAEGAVWLFAKDATVIAMGGQYMRSYAIDCIFAGLHFCFSGYFCARGRSEFSFLHNIISLCLARLPGAYLTSLWFPASLLPMGLATAAGSLVSVIICLIAYRIITRKDPKVPTTA